jgi:hypothetical protein
MENTNLSNLRFRMRPGGSYSLSCKSEEDRKQNCNEYLWIHEKKDDLDLKESSDYLEE